MKDISNKVRGQQAIQTQIIQREKEEAAAKAAAAAAESEAG